MSHDLTPVEAFANSRFIYSPDMGLAYRDDQAMEVHRGAVAQAGELAVHTFCDLDGTLTEPGFTIWDALNKHMTRENRKIHNLLRRQNLRREDLAQFTDVTSDAFQLGALALTFGITMDNVVATTLDGVKIKPEAPEFVHDAEAARATIDIVSAAVSQPIGALQEKYGMTWAQVISNRAILIEGTIRNYDLPIVASTNKNQFGRSAPGADIGHGINLVFGDQPHDAALQRDRSFATATNGNLANLYDEEGPTALQDRLNLLFDNGYHAVSFSGTFAEPRRILRSVTVPGVMPSAA